MTDAEHTDTDRDYDDYEQRAVAVSEDVTDFETALRATFADDRDFRDADTEPAVVIVRCPYETMRPNRDRVLDVPPGTVVIGYAGAVDPHAARLYDDSPSYSLADLRDAWAHDVAPQALFAEGPLPLVGGQFFGRDDTVFLAAVATLVDVDLDKLQNKLADTDTLL